MPDAPKIMVIRHAEKPDGVNPGLNEAGVEGGKDLTIRGWQRAGALTSLFAPARGPLQSPVLATPQFLFASGSASQRPLETLLPLSRLLNITVNTDFGKGREQALAAAVRACGGPVLISWQHEAIAAIAAALTGAAPANFPQWPSPRFDLIWVFDLDDAGKYQFNQVAQRLLDGDQDTVLALPAIN